MLPIITGEDIEKACKEVGFSTSECIDERGKFNPDAIRKIVEKATREGLEATAKILDWTTHGEGDGYELQRYRDEATAKQLKASRIAGEMRRCGEEIKAHFEKIVIEKHLGKEEPKGEVVAEKKPRKSKRL